MHKEHGEVARQGVDVVRSIENVVKAIVPMTRSYGAPPVIAEVFYRLCVVRPAPRAGPLLACSFDPPSKAFANTILQR